MLVGYWTSCLPNFWSRTELSDQREIKAPVDELLKAHNPVRVLTVPRVIVEPLERFRARAVTAVHDQHRDL